MAARRRRRGSISPMEWLWTVRATSTSPMLGTTASAKWIPRGPSRRWRATATPTSPATAARPRRRCSTDPWEWRWTVRATSTSPTLGTTASARWIPRGSSRRSRAAQPASAATADRRHRRSLPFPLASRWTVRATSTSPTPATAASARWTPRGSSRRSRARAQPASAAMAAWRRRRSSGIPQESRWTVRTTSTSPTRTTAASARWTPPGTSPRSWPHPMSTAPPTWRWMGPATSTRRRFRMSSR